MKKSGDVPKDVWALLERFQTIVMRVSKGQDEPEEREMWLPFLAGQCMGYLTRLAHENRDLRLRLLEITLNKENDDDDDTNDD